MRCFTPKEDQFLRANYRSIPAKRMSAMLGRSASTARQRMKRLGLVVPPEITAAFKQQSQFKKGHRAANTGKKQAEYMDAAAIARTKKTRFKKGRSPHNTKYDGYERISKDGYREVRIRKGKFVLKHRMVWEKYRGKIPRGMLIVFKDGNKQNIKLSNLEMISLRENMLRNSSQRFGPEVFQLIQLRGALIRKIKNTRKKLTA